MTFLEFVRKHCKIKGPDGKLLEWSDAQMKEMQEYQRRASEEYELTLVKGRNGSRLRWIKKQ